MGSIVIKLVVLKENEKPWSLMHIDQVVTSIKKVIEKDACFDVEISTKKEEIQIVPKLNIMLEVQGIFHTLQNIHEILSDKVIAFVNSYVEIIKHDSHTTEPITVKNDKLSDLLNLTIDVESTYDQIGQVAICAIHNNFPSRGKILIV